MCHVCPLLSSAYISAPSSLYVISREAKKLSLRQWLSPFLSALTSRERGETERGANALVLDERILQRQVPGEGGGLRTAAMPLADRSIGNK